LIDNYLDILLNDLPIIDLRAPCEFSEGAFPCAQSMPLMNDDERKKIGTCYKQKGQMAAIKLGEKLVSGDKKDQRIQQWIAFIKTHPNAVIYCFRGGMRSQISQMWLDQHGISVPRVKGGYKALRRFLIDALAIQSKQQDFITLSGLTGTGKTKFILQTTKYIDLEGLANHKGSVFGNNLSPQPTPINFENTLSIALLRNRDLAGMCLIEDEGNRVGKLAIPLSLVDAMKTSPILVLTESLEYRIKIIYEDYILNIRHNAYEKMGSIAGEKYFSDTLLGSLTRIKKRLGFERYTLMHKQLSQAISNDNKDLFYSSIEELMVKYYDPMYQYQLSQKQQRVVFQGSRHEVSEFLQDKVVTF